MINAVFLSFGLCLVVVGLAVVWRRIAVKSGSRERNLREKNEHLMSLIETVSDVLVFKDGASKLIVMNQAALTFFNLQQADWMGKTSHEFCAQTSDLVLCEDSDELAYRRGNEYSYEAQRIGVDGAIQYFEVRKFPRFDSGGMRAGLAISCRNVTAAKAAERQLQTNNYKEQVGLLNTVLDTLPAQVVLLKQNGRLHGSNRHWKKACRSYCSPDSDPETCNVEAGNCPHLKMGDASGVASVLSGRSPQHICEYSTETLDQTRRYSRVVSPVLSPPHEVTDTVVMVTDVTDLRCAHEAIRRSEQQMRAITENSPDLIIRLDCAGRLMFANRALLDYLLMNDRNVQGMSVDGLWQDDRVRGQWRDAFGLLMNGRSREDIVFEEESCGVNRVFQAYLVAERVDANVVSVLAVIRDITEMRQAEQLLRESRDRLRLLAAEYEMVLEAEKRHIARELHDETGQILSALRLNMGMLGVKNSVTLAARLEKMAYLLDRATASIRQVVTNLRPAVIDMGLVPALEWLCDDCSRLFPAITYSFDVQGELPEFNENAIILVFRMAQEALNNATRHAQASRISVCLTGDANGWQLIVEDDGSGFDVPGRSRDRECFGLLGLRERALAVGGDLDILSQSGAGTRVILAVTTGR